jgi:hypothetical protein
LRLTERKLLHRFLGAKSGKWKAIPVGAIKQHDMADKLPSRYRSNSIPVSLGIAFTYAKVRVLDQYLSERNVYC